MQRVWVWTRRVLVAVAVLAVLLAAGVYTRAEVLLRRTHVAPPSPPPVIVATPASIAAGQRLARLLGCTGCHGPRLEGRLFFSEPGVADLVAPNLSRLVPSYSDAELERAIRHGIRRDGTGLFAMPAESFYHLDDEDLAALIAFLRRQPRVDGHEQPTRIGPLGRLGIATGQFTTAPASMDHAAPRLSRRSDTAAQGRYLATVACAECHGLALQGGLDGRAPPLSIAAGYSDEAFRHLMKTGETPGKRDLYLMDDVARERFSHFTDEEVTALHTYLRTLAAAPRP